MVGLAILGRKPKMVSPRLRTGLSDDFTEGTVFILRDPIAGGTRDDAYNIPIAIEVCEIACHRDQTANSTSAVHRAAQIDAPKVSLDERVAAQAVEFRQQIPTVVKEISSIGRHVRRTIPS